MNVPFNYRVDGFSFLVGKEVEEADITNLVIHDGERSIVENVLGSRVNLVPIIYRTDSLGLGPGVH